MITLPFLDQTWFGSANHQSSNARAGIEIMVLQTKLTDFFVFVNDRVPSAVVLPPTIIKFPIIAKYVAMRQPLITEYFDVTAPPTFDYRKLIRQPLITEYFDVPAPPTFDYRKLQSSDDMDWSPSME